MFIKKNFCFYYRPMKIRFYVLSLLLFCTIATAGAQRLPTLDDKPLKEVFASHFLFGVAVNNRQVSGRDLDGQTVVRHHFNSIVAENCMKSSFIHPTETHYHWSDADSFVEFGEANGMSVIGHTLIWHSQLSSWFVKDNNGGLVTADVLRQRMRDHIHAVVGRYKGRIRGWDVVNEALEDDGAFRPSVFYQILGEEYIYLAFRYAHEADPEAELYYNDYGMDKPGKRLAVVKLIRELQRRGLRIDAVGMQGHMGMTYPDLNEFESSLSTFASTGVKVMITEWDLGALPMPWSGADVGNQASYTNELNPYPNGLPSEVSQLWNERAKQIFCLFLRHSDVISRVTLWGVSDGDSWKNNWPIRGRTDYPLLFDREYRLKPFMKSLVEESNSRGDTR